MSVLRLENLSIGYDKKAINAPFSIALESGNLYTLLGKNGVGKSTLIKTLARLLPPVSGNFFVEEMAADTISNEDFAKKVSFVFTNQSINKGLTVFELIALARQPYTNWLHRLSEQDVEVVKLATMATDTQVLEQKRLYQLSDGQLQRVLIARAIAQDTKIVVLDEPSTHLDLYFKVQLFNMLRELSILQKKCVLFSCHDLDLALQWSDKCLLITENANYFNTPDLLIDHGVFDDYFDSKDIVFDRHQRRWNVIKK